MKSLFILILPLLLTSCFKTAEDIAREKKVDEMSVQLEQSQQLVADLTTQVQMLQTQLATYTGQMEEQTYSQRTEQEKRLKTWQELSAQMDTVNKLVEGQDKDLNAMKKELSDQKAYLQKVLKALKTTASSSSRGGSSLQDAHKLFEKNKLKEAKSAYLAVLDEGKIGAAKRNGVYYNLGLINYWNKSYDDAISFFSKIYTNYPKSSYAPRALYYIGYSLEKSGEKDAAKQAFGELVEKYPKSSQAKKVKEKI
jgi:TolA-binding protein